MKTDFNNEIKATPVINEISLFRTMANGFNTNRSKGTFVEEVHGQKGFVEYYSNILGRIKKVEIADLMFITYNKSNREIRICFLQAKFKSKPCNGFLSFAGNIFQWELLSEKPDVSCKQGLHFPSNILNFAKGSYESITSYGVFYVDKAGEIDFLYTLPMHLNPYNLKVKRGITPFYFRTPMPYKCPDITCRIGINRNEVISTCSMDIFHEQMLLGKIGAPINTSIQRYIKQMIIKMRDNEPRNPLLNEIAERINVEDFNGRDLENLGGDGYYYPHAIIIITNG